MNGGASRRKRQVVQAKQPLSIGPHLGGIESRAFGKLAELLNTVLVGVLRVDGLALGERYRRTVESNSLGSKAFDVHFDAPKPLVIERGVLKISEVEICA